MLDDPSLWVLIVIVVLALDFGVVNGFNDAANAVAASIGSRADGQPISPNNISPAFTKVSRRAGLKMRFHDLRHSHATLMLRAGIHPKIVSERLGHATVALTLDTYSHVAPGLQEAAAARFDEAFASRYNEPRNEAVAGHY